MSIQQSTMPTLADLGKQALQPHLENDIATLRKQPRLSLDEALDYGRRNSAYRKIFKGSVEQREYSRHVKALRQRYLPLRAIDAIRSGLKQKESERPTSIRAYVSVIEQEQQPRKALKKLEREFLLQAKEHEEAVSLASEISCLHGTNESVLIGDGTLIPTGKLLDLGIAPMSGEIDRGGMERCGVNQLYISCDTIEGISRCWEYASKISHSFTPPDEEQFIARFTENLEALKTSSPDNDYWDSCIVSSLRLKQWNPELFHKLYVEHREKIEAIQKQCVSNPSEMEMRILKAVNYPQEKLVQAASDEELREQINRELRKSRYCSEFEGAYLYEPDAYGSACLNFLKKICSHSALDNRYSKSYFILECIKNIIRFRINGERELANYALYQEKLLGISSTSHDEVWNQLKSSIPGVDEMGEEDRETVPLRIQHSLKESLGDIPGPLSVEKILKKMVRDKIDVRIRENMKPFEKRYQRFLHVFSSKPPVVKIDDVQREILAHPHPLLLASTKIKPIRYVSEYNFSQAKLGSEIDLFFVPEENIKSTQNWLQAHQLEGQVRVYSTSLVQEIEKLSVPLIHSSTQVIDFAPSLDKWQHELLNAQLNEHVFPLYAQPYSDGSDRVHHGVPHAVRAVLFSICFMELYHSNGTKVKTKPGNLQLTVGAHDCARQDDGVDLWDKESGEACTGILTKLEQDKSEAEFLGRCIAEKDKPVESIEQSIVHDSDCVEICRCLYDMDGFNANELWALKDLGGDTVYPFIKEAKAFITFTEQSQIKHFLAKSKEPYKALLQILYSVRDSFPLIYALNRIGVDVLATPAQHILTEEVESLCCGIFGASSVTQKVREKERKMREI